MLHRSKSILFFLIIVIQLILLIEATETCNPKENTGDCSGYYLYDIDNISGEGTLYECRNNTKLCDVIENAPGYYKVTDLNYKIKIPYIQCGEGKCKKLAIKDMKNSCNKENTGELVNIQTNNGIMDGVHFCINHLNLIKFSNNTSVYLLGSNGNNNLFSNSNHDQYVLVSITYDSITPMNTTNIESNTYLINNSLYSIENDKHGNFTINKLTSSGLEAFEYVYAGFAKLINDFSKKLSKEVLSKTLLYLCQNGKCVSTSGTLKYKSSSSKVEVANCSGYCISKQGPVKCNIMNTGKAFYNSSKSKFQICVNSGNSTKDIYEFKEIRSNSTNHFITLKTIGTDYYELFVSDKGGNMVGLSTGSNYLMNKEDERNMKFLTCYQNSNHCEIKSTTLVSGYFINSESDSPNSLIYCDDYDCKTITESNGYYINSDGGIIRCNSFACELLERKEVGSSCTNHPNEVIYYNNNYNSFQYCNDTSEVDFSDKEFYITLNNINSSNLDFPTNIVSGNDTILLKVNQYSIKQVVTDNDGICINNKDHKIVTNTSCKKSKSTKFYCLSANETCTNKLNLNANANGGKLLIIFNF
ncbi:hypothetical protein U3516DRAFT_811049 [Neocallimastix sp. 'constans']